MNKTLAQIDDRYGIQWRFDTARYTVAFWAEEEHLPPEDSFCDERDVAFAREDEPAHWFCAFVGVFKRPELPADDKTGFVYAGDEDYELVAHDCLGGCSCSSFREFYTGHRQGGPDNRNCLATKERNVVICHYFPDMVRTAIAEARVGDIRSTMVAA